MLYLSYCLITDFFYLIFKIFQIQAPDFKVELLFKIYRLQLYMRI